VAGKVEFQRRGAEKRLYVNIVPEIGVIETPAEAAEA
jgi:hypothetical protein